MHSYDQPPDSSTPVPDWPPSSTWRPDPPHRRDLAELAERRGDLRHLDTMPLWLSLVPPVAEDVAPGAGRLRTVVAALLSRRGLTASAALALAAAGVAVLITAQAPSVPGSADAALGVATSVPPSARAVGTAAPAPTSADTPGPAPNGSSTARPVVSPTVPAGASVAVTGPAGRATAGATAARTATADAGTEGASPAPVGPVPFGANPEPVSGSPRPSGSRPTTSGSRPTTTGPTLARSTPVPLCGAPANPFGYTFCGGPLITRPAAGLCGYLTCVPGFAGGTGYLVECRDDRFSLSGGRPGSCSADGGQGRTLYS